MNPFVLKALPYAVMAVLLVLLAVMADLYLAKRDELSTLTASVKTLGEMAEKKVAEEKKRGVDNLTTVKAKYEKDTKQAASDAVANYRMRHPAAGSCPVPGNGSGKPVDDGTKQEPILDDATIVECGSDARKVAAFQLYCELNHCPVKD